jgi:hypothetical protein
MPTPAMLDRSAFLGPVFECFVASEIVKPQLNGGPARSAAEIWDDHADERLLKWKHPLKRQDARR